MTEYINLLLEEVDPMVPENRFYENCNNDPSFYTDPTWFPEDNSPIVSPMPENSPLYTKIEICDSAKSENRRKRNRKAAEKHKQKRLKKDENLQSQISTLNVDISRLKKENNDLINKMAFLQNSLCKKL